jgi:hypothetical protein
MNEEKRGFCGLLPSRKKEVILCRHRQEAHTSVKLIFKPAKEARIMLRPFHLQKRPSTILHRLASLGDYLDGTQISPTPRFHPQTVQPVSESYQIRYSGSHFQVLCRNPCKRTDENYCIHWNVCSYSKGVPPQCMSSVLLSHRIVSLLKGSERGTFCL